MKTDFLLAFIFALIAGYSPFARADDVAALKARLHTAEAESALTSSDVKPWHLILSFQLRDAKGQPGETGTIEEWWAAPTRHKTVYTSPSYTNTEIVNEDGLYKSAPDLYPPEMLALIHNQSIHPMPELAEIDDARPDLRKKDFGKFPLDCIMLDQPIKNIAYPPLGLFPTFCFDRDKTTLRASFDYGTMSIVRNRMGLFQQKSVALDQTISIDDQIKITAHIEKLTGLTLTPAYFQPTTEMSKVDEQPVTVSDSVMAGSVINKIPPIYPERSKRNHADGDVILRAVIGTDGRVHHLRIQSAADSDMAIASLIAVGQWTYQPYLVNGKPVNVDTTITTHFRFGRP